jgi:hypothetical protein
MKKKIQIFIFIIGSSLITIACSCLASERVDLVASGLMSVEYEHCEHCGKIHVSKIYVYQQGDKLIVSGKVKRDCNSITSDQAYIEVVLLSPDGILLEKIDTQYIPRIIPRKGERGSRFTVNLATIPPKGSIIRVRCY